jgi:uncharacterized protein YjbI with pentapeptide repeats
MITPEQFQQHAAWLRDGSGKCIEAVNANLSGADLRWAHLSRVDLRGANLNGANLRNAELSGANLSGAHLIKADLGRAKLSGANLRDAELIRADLSRVDLIGANLSGANLSYANLSGANLSGANLSGANLSGANLSGDNLRGANLSGANLRRANLSGVYLSDADLRGAYLRDANLSDADLRGADLRWAIGNMREIKSAQFDQWTVAWSSDVLAIGCQQHAIEKWRTADPRWIDAMDSKAKYWWARYNALVLQLIDASPATGVVLVIGSSKESRASSIPASLTSSIKLTNLQEEHTNDQPSSLPHWRSCVALQAE